MTIDDPAGEFAKNLDRILPAAICLDISASMAEAGKIESLNEAVGQFINAVRKDKRAARTVAWEFITFQGDPAGDPVIIAHLGDFRPAADLVDRPISSPTAILRWPRRSISRQAARRGQRGCQATAAAVLPAVAGRDDRWHADVATRRHGRPHQPGEGPVVRPEAGRDRHRHRSQRRRGVPAAPLAGPASRHDRRRSDPGVLLVSQQRVRVGVERNAGEATTAESFEATRVLMGAPWRAATAAVAGADHVAVGKSCEDEVRSATTGEGAPSSSPTAPGPRARSGSAPPPPWTPPARRWSAGSISSSA